VIIALAEDRSRALAADSITIQLGQVAHDRIAMASLSCVASAGGGLAEDDLASAQLTWNGQGA
jgi:hypothetical protein